MTEGPARPPLINVTEMELNELRLISESWHAILQNFIA
jgi:hypothetical protein